ncbi:DUF2892 domain-containing protein [Bradyrhizobium sp. ORS 285]|uniref:YgaP family membrane protein n=2 Tax=Bradyrhizobium sp. ORS 285 TaxID=115808 RepID=UPI00352FA6C5
MSPCGPYRTSDRPPARSASEAQPEASHRLPEGSYRHGADLFTPPADRQLLDQPDSDFFPEPRTVSRLSSLYVSGASETTRLRQEVTMLYRKNVAGWESWVRLLAGAIMIACGLLGLKGMPVAYLIAGVGVMTALTGVFGYCPACALAGRKLRAEP